jgi:hypothetical protein
MADRLEPGWEAATWEGSRRRQLRRALRLSPRQRLEAMVALAAAASQLAPVGVSLFRVGAWKKDSWNKD